MTSNNHDDLNEDPLDDFPLAHARRLRNHPPPGRARAEGEEMTVRHGIELASSASYFVCAVLWAMAAFAHKAKMSGAYFEVKDSAGHTRQSRRAAWLNFWAAIFTGLGALTGAVASCLSGF